VACLTGGGVALRCTGLLLLALNFSASLPVEWMEHTTGTGRWCECVRGGRNGVDVRKQQGVSWH
jgi:hypothetical protein